MIVLAIERFERQVSADPGAEFKRAPAIGGGHMAQRIGMIEALNGVVAARQDAMAQADLTVLCLPDEAAREAVALAPEGARILDASSAHRTAEGWVFGFPELGPKQAQNIAQARLVSNITGCVWSA